MLEVSTFNIIPTDIIEDYIDEYVGKADKSEENFDAEANLSEQTIDAGYESSDVVKSSI